MSEKKTIQINPELFRIPVQEKQKRPPRTTNKPIRVKNPNMPKNKTVRNQIMKMIRSKQQEKYKELFDDKGSNMTMIAPVTAVDEFKQDFNQSLEYLSDLAKRESDKVPVNYAKNHTLRNRMPSSSSLSPIYENVSLDLPNVFHDLSPAPKSHSMVLSPHNKNPYIRPYPQNTLSTGRPYPQNTLSTGRPYPQNTLTSETPYLPVIQNISSYGTTNSTIRQDQTKYKLLPPPPYGALKVGGTKPTYRTYNQTIKNREQESVIPPIGNPNSIDNIKRISELRQKMEIQKKEEEEKKNIKKKSALRRLKQKKIYKRTYRVGKSKYQPKIGVLVSNRTIRSNISTKTQLLKQEPIQNVKKFLIKKGFIKVGTPTPNDILRKMYESVVLICGEVQNHNPENLLYNYVHDAK